MLLVFLSASFVMCLIYFNSSKKESELTINVTSDIHAGSQKERDYSKYTPGNIIHPKEGVGAFREFLNQPGDVFIALGDNTNKSSEGEYAEKLKSITDESGKDVLFGYGNHDSEEGMKVLGSQPPFYYVKDYESVRIIVLNTEEVYFNEDGQNDGGLSDVQLTWLAEQVKTDKTVLIAMSKPPYKKDMQTKKKGYREFFSIIHRENVKHIFGGDYHVAQGVIMDSNINFHFVPALTLEGNNRKFVTVTINQKPRSLLKKLQEYVTR